MLNLLVKHWRSTNDGVMGGVSSGQVVESALGLIFKGDLSLENSGGFSSVNRLVTEDLSQSIGIRLRVKGDGRTYQFSARRSFERGGVSWRKAFQTDRSAQTIEILYQELIPTHRGKLQPHAKVLDPVDIGQIGFLIADKRAGEFALCVLGIEILIND